MNQQRLPITSPQRPTLPLLAALALLGGLLTASPARAQSAAPMTPTPTPTPAAPHLRALRSQTDKSLLQTALILVDGQEVPLAELDQQVSPEKIESIDVLKGDQALAKYGARGRNGVVLVTTKK